ncbi:hypothetical protein HDU92_004650 [Lobulomyces angularis]|nr:hypothetical protein HDU92_004650 [Lobulomyces angularis]
MSVNNIQIPLPFGDFNDADPIVKYWTFVLYCFIVAIAAIFYIFYSNRVIGQIASWIINFVTWRKYNCYIDIEALSFAPLNGKLLFRNLRYHSRNQSFLVIRGYIEFRFWLSAVKSEDDFSEDNVNKNLQENPPCRIKIRLDGFEWFIYNRSAAYDNLRDIINKDGNPNEIVETLAENFLPHVNKHAKHRFLRDVLPVHIVSDEGAIILGNSDLPTILTMSYKKLDGIYGTCRAPSYLDYYRAKFISKINTVKILSRTNVDYKEPTLNDIARTRDLLKKSIFSRLKSFFKSKDTLPRQSEEILLQNISNSNIEHHSWSGLARYRMNEVPLMRRKLLFKEYAKVKEFLESEELLLTYFSDVPGPYFPIDETEPVPCWGIDLVVNDGFVHYGPWNNRQRAFMQNFFFPPNYQNSGITQRPTSTEQLRILEKFKINVEFNGLTTCRIPFREQTKDYQYFDTISQDEINLRGSGRPYGWIDLKFTNRSSIQFDIPLVIDKSGYNMGFNVNLQNLMINTSLNYSNLLETSCLLIYGDLQFPIEWNESRLWDFSVSIQESNIWLLRDHITLVTDLIKDFSSPSLGLDYFVPIEYKVNFELLNSSIWLCCNYDNVIDHHNDVGENIYLVLSMKNLNGCLSLPFFSYEPDNNEIGFELMLNEISLRFSFPLTTTFGSSLTESSKDIGIIKSINLRGTYLIHRLVSKGNTDVLSIECSIEDIRLQVFGFLIRFFIIFVENYLSAFTSNHITSYEYKKRNQDPSRYLLLKKLQCESSGPSNILDLVLSVFLNNILISVPSGLFENSESVLLRSTQIQLFLRNTSTFQDLQIDINPFNCSLNDKNFNIMSRENIFQENITNQFLFFQDTVCTLHKLFGPLPEGKAYGTDWRINFGQITGQFPLTFLVIIRKCAGSFLYHFWDKDNQLGDPVSNPFLNTIYVNFEKVNVNLSSMENNINVSLTHGLKLHTASFEWTDRTYVEIPDIVITGLGCGLVEIRRTLPQDYVEVFKLEAGISFCLFKRTPDWEEKQTKQKSFIEENDQDTKRLQFLFLERNLPISKEYSEIFFPAFVPPFWLSPKQGVTLTQNESKSFNDRDANYNFTTDTHSFFIRDDISVPSPSQHKSSINIYQKLQFMRKVNDPFFDELGPAMATFYNEEKIRMNSATEEAYDNFDFNCYGETEFFKDLLMDDVVDPNFVYSFKSTKSLKLMAMPAFLTVLTSFFKSTEELENDATLDSIADSIQFSLIKELLSSSHFNFENSYFLFNIPKLHIQLIQDMSFSSDTENFLSEVDKQTMNELLENSFTSFDIIFEDLKVNSLQMKDLKLKEICEFRLFLNSKLMKLSGCFLGTMSSANSIIAGIEGIKVESFPEKKDLPTFLDISLNTLELIIERNKLEFNSNLNTNDLIIVAINQIPEILYGSIFSWFKNAGILSSRVNSSSLKLYWQRKLLLGSLSELEKHLDINENLPLIRKKFHDAAYQSDLSWKLIYFLRRSLRSLDDEENKILKSNLSNILSCSISIIQDGQLFHKFCDNLIKYNIFRDCKDNLFVRGLFEIQYIEHTDAKESSQKRINFHSKNNIVQFILFRNQLEASSFSVKKNFISLNFTQLEHINENNEAIKYMDCLFNADFTEVNIEINPFVFIFALHFARVLKWLKTSKLDKPVTSPRTSRKNITPFIYSGVIKVKQFSLLAEVHNVKFFSKLEDFLFNVSSFNSKIGLKILTAAGDLSSQNVTHEQLAKIFSVNFGLLNLNITENLRTTTVLGEVELREVFATSSYCEKNNSFWNKVVAALLIESIVLTVPHSILKFHMFFERLADEIIPRYSYLYTKLLKEISFEGSATVHKNTGKKSHLDYLGFQTEIKRLRIDADIITSLDVCYYAEGLVLLLDRSFYYVKNDDNSWSRSFVKSDYSGKLIRHTINFTAAEEQPSSVLLPSFTSLGSYLLPEKLNCDATFNAVFSLGVFKTAVEVGVIDQFLTTQSVLGNEFNDIIEIFMFYRRKRKEKVGASLNSEEMPIQQTQQVLRFSVRLEIEGISIEANSPSSNLIFTSGNFDGFVTNTYNPVTNSEIDLNKFKSTVYWCINATGISLLFDHRLNKRSSFDTKYSNSEFYNLAYITIDVVAQNFEETKDEIFEFSPSQNLFILIKKVHGIAVPLREVDSSNLDDHPPVFLLASESLKIISKRFEIGESQISDASIQFIDQFDLRNSAHFKGSLSKSSNYCHLKNVTLEAQYLTWENDKHKKNLTVIGSIKGFELEIDVSISEKIGDLLYIYETSKEKVDLIIPQNSSPLSSPDYTSMHEFKSLSGSSNLISSEANLTPDVNQNTMGQIITYINICSKFEFEAGSCKLRLQDEAGDVLFLPAVSMDIKGNAILGNSNSSLPLEIPEDKALHVKLTIHGSENNLQPTIVKFFDQIFEKMLISDKAAPPDISKESDAGITSTFASIRRQRYSLTFHLVLFQTILKLSCQPASKVVCLMSIQQIDFIISLVPESKSKDIGKQLLCMTGNVQNVSLSLKHQFSPEDCVLGVIPEILINSSLMNQDSASLFAIESVIPFFNFSLNLRHLQDFFSFKKIWISHRSSDKKKNKTSKLVTENIDPNPVVRQIQRDPKEAWSLRLILKVEEINLNLDMGQAIGKSSLKLRNSFLRSFTTSTLFSLYKQSLVFGIEGFQVKSEGRLSGYFNMYNFQFLSEFTSPFIIVPQELNKSKFYATLNSKNIQAQLQYQYEKVLIGEFLNISGEISDFWENGKATVKILIKVEELNLIISQKTFPVLVQMFERIVDLIEEKSVDKILGEKSNSLNVKEEISSVFEKELSSDEDKCVEVIQVFSKLISMLEGHFEIQFGQTVATLTKYNFREPDCAQIVCNSGFLKFNHTVDLSAGDILEDVAVPNANSTVLFHTGFQIRKASSNVVLSEAKESSFEVKDWINYFKNEISSKFVLSVPKMNSVLTTSEKLNHLNQKLIEFSFVADFDGFVDIALNIGLYKYLNQLLKLYKEAFKVQKSATIKLNVNEREKENSDSLSPTSSKGESIVSSPTEASKKMNSYLFFKRGEVRFDPQLKVTGDATPWDLVEWMGLHKDEELPKLYYTLITRNLETGFHTILKLVYDDLVKLM